MSGRTIVIDRGHQLGNHNFPRQDRWGPCVDARGRAGNRIGADLELSIHADASYAAGARGFHARGLVTGVRAFLR